MSGRLEKLRVVDPVLTNLATGYQNAEFVGHHLLPFAYVEKEAGRIPTFGKDVFMEARTERAIRAKSNRLNPDEFDHVTYALDEHDLEYPIDYREDQESMYPLRAHATFTVVEKIRLRHELNTAALVQNLNTYPTSNRLTLTGADQFTDPTSDPEGVIDDAKAAIAAATVQEPNVMVIGQQAWRALKRHPKLRGILADNRSRLVKLADLAEIEAARDKWGAGSAINCASFCCVSRKRISKGAAFLGPPLLFLSAAGRPLLCFCPHRVAACRQRRLGKCWLPCGVGLRLGCGGFVARVQLGEYVCQQPQAHGGEFAAPERLRGVGRVYPAPILRGYRAGVCAVVQPVGGAAGDGVAHVDGPAHSVTPAVAGQ